MVNLECEKNLFWKLQKNKQSYNFTLISLLIFRLLIFFEEQRNIYVERQGIILQRKAETAFEVIHRRK